jgi:hypothetical protein
MRLVVAVTCVALGGCASDSLPDAGDGGGGSDGGDGGGATIAEGGSTDNTIVPIPIMGEAGESGGQASGPSSECARNASCATYCSNLGSAECLPPEAEGLCLEWCVTETEPNIPARCEEIWKEFLTCATCVENFCDTRGEITASECYEISEAVLTCAGPCLRTGEERSVGFGDGSETAYEASHCECPAVLAPGGMNGDRCSSAADCAQECCSCTGNEGKMLARECKDGICVTGAALCAGVASSLFGQTFCHGCQGP